MTMDTEETSAPEPGPSTAQENDIAPETRPTDAQLSSQRVFKKSSPNSKLTLYLASRDLVASQGRIDCLTGVLLIDPDFIDNRKVYGQITLTFRYGREDEEVMGLKFCNEAVMCLTQLYPPPEQPIYTTTPLQEALLKRLGANAYPFTMEITPLAPPSVQLVPAKEYNGAPIGTSYDIRAYVAERMDEKLHKRATVRMGIRVVQRAFAPPSPYRYVPGAGRTTKEQAKLNKKALLYGCKSAPLENRFFNNSGLSRSAEIVGQVGQSDLKPEVVRTGHRSMPECVAQEMDTTENKKHEDAENNTPNHRSPLKYPNQVSFSPKCDKSEENRENKNGLEHRKGSLKEAGPEIRMESVESNEDRLSDFYRSLCSAKRPSMAAYLAEVPNPKAVVEKQFLLSDGKIFLSASLDKGIYSHGEEIRVSVQIRNNSSKTIRRIKTFVVQHVDVCMFSNGKFKNVVAMLSDKESCPIGPTAALNKTYTLLPLNSSTKNWIALEDTYNRSNSSLASTVSSVTGNPEERNVFAIYVSYYVKVKLMVSVMGGDVSLKLPFTLMHTCSDYDSDTLTRLKRVESESRRYVKPHKVHQRSPADDIKPEKDGT
ncbi:arrestin homolog [Anthonomus grandis grandis]|uniref:arrestin homolog n=1 Tax=Anthonomus grandis grandis TaxID=2921223 RepID=UPI00216633F5|nr:arrestin homolog [Anthonomus grandis grandis]